jgi:hypothetical protein
VKPLLMGIATSMALAAVVGATWLERRHLACARRSAALSRQVEDLRRDANEELRVGASKADVAHFYEKRKIPFQIFQVTDLEATGTVFATGCSPFGCGTDEAFIVVRVKLSPQGIVTEQSNVGAAYKNCL